MKKRSIQRRMERAIIPYLVPPITLYDIGVGPKSEWDTLRKTLGSVRVCGVEPNPETYARLVPRFPGLLLNVAIDERPERLSISWNPVDLGNTGAFSEGASSAKVETITLDHFDEINQRPTDILLWMDIEGMELRALRSGIELLKSRRVRWLNLEERSSDEVPHEGWAKPSETRDFLAGFGYRPLKVYNRHRTHHDVIYGREEWPAWRR